LFHRELYSYSTKVNKVNGGSPAGLSRFRGEPPLCEHLLALWVFLLNESRLSTLVPCYTLSFEQWITLNSDLCEL
jgi:hypothetical protein